MIVCAVAATGKFREPFEQQQVTIDNMQKTMDNLNAAKAKNAEIKKQHAAVKKEHDQTKSKAESIEAEVNLYNADPKDLQYTDREILDKKNAIKKADDCEATLAKTENSIVNLRLDVADLEKQVERLKQEKRDIEKEIDGLNTSIASYKEKIKNLKDIEIPEVKGRIDQHTKDYFACVAIKSWNPSATGGDVAFWNSYENQYISGTININTNNFTIGLLINAPYNGSYQSILKTNNDSSFNNYRIEMGMQANYFVVVNGGQSMSIPFTNGQVFLIIVQTQNGAAYFLNGRRVGGSNHNWNYSIRNISFYTINSGGIRDLAVIRRVLSDSEVQKYEGYFAYKWFKSGHVLPANHPYREEIPYK